MIRIWRPLFLALLAFCGVCLLHAWQKGCFTPPPALVAGDGDEGPMRQTPILSVRPQSQDVLLPASRGISAAAAVLALSPLQTPEEPEPVLPPGPKLALVIDDFGHSLAMARKIAKLGLTATWAVIPDLPESRAVADFARAQGQPFLLHLPMQALVDPVGSPEYKIGIDTTAAKIKTLVNRWQRDYPHAIGVNNHRGSRATSDHGTMVRFMKALAGTKWGFLDSRTSGKTIAYKIAKEYHIPVAQNRVFIDGTSELSEMKKQFALALNKAKIHGSVVAICHAREKTLPFLEYAAKEDFRPVQFVTLGLLWKEQYAKGEIR